MANVIANYLKYAHLQTIAEAFIEPKRSTPGKRSEGETLLTSLANPDGILENGNTRNTRLTPAEIEAFAPNWTVVEQIANTATGFSGTLFHYTGGVDKDFGLVPEEYVLVFRSTEFMDDPVRDSQATNASEIREHGWAFGQIDDMDHWVSSLYSTGLIPAGTRPTVVGYSLAGHLAAAYNRLYSDMGTAPIYTFNGAGTGTIEEGHTLTDVLDTFRTHRSFGANADLFSGSSTALRYLYLDLKDILKEGADVTLTQVENAIGRDIYVQGLVPISEAGRLLREALNRVKAVVFEAERVNAGIPSGGASEPALPVPTREIAGISLDYQMAVLRAAELTDSYHGGAITGGAHAVYGRAMAPELQMNILELFGANPPSAVANSQLHHGLPVPMFIEDQPLWRGSVVGEVGTESLKAGEIKLLVDTGWHGQAFQSRHRHQGQNILHRQRQPRLVRRRHAGNREPTPLANLKDEAVLAVSMTKLKDQ